MGSATFFAGAEELDELLGEGGTGGEFDAIDSGAAQFVQQIFAPSDLLSGPGAAGGGVGGIDQDTAASFRVTEIDEAGGGECDFLFIADPQGDEVMAASGDAEQITARGHEEIGQEEGDGAAALDLVEEGEGWGEVGSFGGGEEGEDFGDEAQDVGRALGWGDIFFDAVGEEDDADAVLVGDGGEGEESSDFRDEVTFKLGAAAVGEGGGDIDEEDDGQLTFFGELFDIGGAVAGGDVPIDGTDIVTGDVFADLLEFDTLAFEDGVVAAGEDILDGVTGADFDSPNFSDDIPGEHCDLPVCGG